MAKGIDIAIAADTRSAMSAINRGIIDPLEDVSEILEDIGKDSDKATDKLEDGMRDAQRRTDDARDEIRDLRDELNRAGRQGKRSGDDIGDGMRRAGDGIGKIGEASGELKQELAQNMGEAVSSFRGDAEDISQIGQDTFGGLAATVASVPGFGIPAAIGLAGAAAGWGIVTGKIQEQQENVQKLKEYFAEAWQTAVEGGQNYIAATDIIAEVNSIRFDPDRAEEYKRITEDANKLELDRNTLMQAAAGDQEALNLVIERSNELRKEYGERYQEAHQLGSDATAETLEDLDLEGQKVLGLVDRWREYGQINDENRQKAVDAAEFTSDYLLKTIANATSATEAVDDFGNKLITLPEGEEIVIDAKTGKATSDVSKFKKDTDEKIRQLNAKDITLAVNAAVRQAQDDVNRFVAANDGRSFRLHGRVTVDSGWDK